MKPGMSSKTSRRLGRRSDPLGAPLGGPLRGAIARAGGFRLSDGFISPLDLVEIGLVTAEEAAQLHELEKKPPSAYPPSRRRGRPFTAEGGAEMMGSRRVARRTSRRVSRRR